MMRPDSPRDFRAIIINYLFTYLLSYIISNVDMVTQGGKSKRELTSSIIFS